MIYAHHRVNFFLIELYMTKIFTQSPLKDSKGEKANLKVIFRHLSHFHCLICLTVASVKEMLLYVVTH